jgi:leukotriene-A4 hydrolase
MRYCQSWLAGKLAAKSFGLDWVTQQWLYFLNEMPRQLTSKQLGALDEAYGFSKTHNAEIAHSWFLLVIANDYQPSFPRLEEYLMGIGRRKLVMPLYEQLIETPSGKEFAKRVYAKARLGYHPDTVAAIDAIVDPPAESSE